MTATGKRKNNEDSYRIGQNGVFLVCDGVGGVEKGEVASEIVADTFLRVFSERPDADPRDALREAERALSAHIDKNPDSAGMATTLTFSQVRKDGILVAWVGDSRVYQFRKGQIVYVTKDHSWVNEAVEAGILTPEEAVDHPKSNVITRAVQGTDRPAKADQVLLKDIRPGDCIMHCSDGVLEAWDDEDLSALFNSDDDIDAMMAKLQADCETDSRDNYTAIIYRVDEATISPLPDPRPIEKTRVPEPVEKHSETMVFGETTKTRKSWVDRWFWNYKVPLPFLVGFLLLLPMLYWLFSGRPNQVGPEKKDSSHTGRSTRQVKEEVKVKQDSATSDSANQIKNSPSGTNGPQEKTQNSEERPTDTEKKVGGTDNDRKVRRTI